MFEDLLPLGLEEAPDLFDSRVLFEQLGVFELRAVLRVVPHQVLGEEDTRVEARPDAWVNLVRALFVRQSVDLTREQLDAGEEHWVQLAGQIDVVVLVGVWDLDDLLLEMQQVLHIACLEVLREQLRLVIVSRSVV